MLCFRSRRASTKLVTAATKSALLQTTPEFHKNVSSVIDSAVRNSSKTVKETKKDVDRKVNNVKEKKKIPGKKAPFKEKLKESSNQASRDTRKEEKPHTKIVRKTETRKEVETKTSNKRKANEVNTPNKKKKVDKSPDARSKIAESPEDNVRRSRRETTRISTLATLNSSNFSDVENQSVASSTDVSTPSNKTKSQNIPSPQRSKRQTTALSSLATSSALNPDKKCDFKEKVPKPKTEEQHIKGSDREKKQNKKVSNAKISRKPPPLVQPPSTNARRSVRSSTAINTLATTNAANQVPFVVTESSEDDEEAEEADKESNDGDNKVHNQNVQRKSRGRTKAEPTPLSPNNPFAAITREYKEQQKIAAKLNRKRKSSLSPTDRPRLLTEEENNRLFDSLFDGDGSSQELEETPKPPKRSSISRPKVKAQEKRTNSTPVSEKASTKLTKSVNVSKPASTKQDSKVVPNPKPPNNISPSNLKWIQSTSTPLKSPPRIIAPWRQICDGSKVNKVENDSHDDDVYEFGGPPVEPAKSSNNDEPSDR